MQRLLFLLMIITAANIHSCKKENPIAEGPKLIFKFRLDSTQARLGNLGEPAGIPSGNAAQSPRFNGISAHYIELAPTALTALGSGVKLYHQKETNAGGATAIDHNFAVIRKDGEIFFEIPMSKVPKGTYEWLRVSLSYQNYEIDMRIDTVISGFSINQSVPATVASYVGYNTFISSFKVKNRVIAVNANKKQGYWGAEVNANFGGFKYDDVFTGDAPGTTVPNPIQATSPIPAGSCVVTGAFASTPLEVTGNEKKDLVVEVSLSINKSFEWKDTNPNGLFEPLKGEKVVDMGLRGMIPRILP